MKKAFQISLVFFSVLFFNVAYSQDSYVVNAPTLNVRTAPSTQADILGKLEAGDVVSVIDFNDADWWKISFYGYEGYVASKFLVTPEASSQYKDWKKESANTGDNPECENIIPEYNYDLDNELLIRVGSDADVVVKLMSSSTSCIRVAYIKAGDNYAMKNIPEGIYFLKLAYGNDFRSYTQNGQCINKFLRNAIYKTGENKLNFYKKKQPDTREGDSIVSHWIIPSFELSLNVEFTSNDFHDFHSNKVTETEFNK